MSTRMERVIALLEAEYADTYALALATEVLLMDAPAGPEAEELNALANRLALDNNVLRVAIRAAKQVSPG